MTGTAQPQTANDLCHSIIEDALRIDALAYAIGRLAQARETKDMPRALASIEAVAAAIQGQADNVADQAEMATKVPKEAHYAGS
ncbi:MAG: hypothetical protein AAF311_07220 [Pseudomonadota bacterium]